MSSVYQQVLEAVKETLDAMTPLGQPLAGWRITLRKEPSFIGELDALPQVVISPRRDLGEQPHRLTFGNVVQMDYEVIVGTFVLAEQELPSLWQRLDARQAIRYALWNVAFAENVMDGFDATYQPAFFEGGQPPPGADGNWQLYRFRVKTQRTDTGR